MERHDALDPQIPLLEVLEKTSRKHVDRFTRFIQVDDDECPLARQIGHQHCFRVVARRRVQVHRHHVVGDDLLVGDRLNLEWPRILRKRVRHARVRPLDNLLDERRVSLMRDDGQPFGDGRPDSSRMVEMVMAVDDVRQWFVWPQLARLCNHRERPSVVLRCVDEHQMI